jgi:thioredoxin-related protein
MRSTLISLLRALLVALCVAAGPAQAAEPQAGFNPSPYAIEIPKWFKETFLDFPEDVRDAAKAGRRVMLYFGQDGCPYCKQLMEGSFGQRDIAEKTQAHFDAIALNIWGDRETVWVDGKTRSEKELARFLKVQFTPSLLFLDEQGRVVLRLNGLYPPDKFRAALEYVAQRKESSVPFAQWMAQPGMAQPAGSAGAAALNEHPLFTRGPARLDRSKRPAGKPLVVFFEQAQCAACDEMHAGSLKRRETLALLSKFDVARVDLRGNAALVAPDGRAFTESEWARELRVDYAPSLVFFDQRGREIFRGEAYLRPFHFQSALEYVSSGSYRTESNFQRYIQARAEAFRRKGVAVDLWR